MDSCTQSKNISPTGVKQEKKQRKIKTLHKKNVTSPFIKYDDYDCCDSFISGYCRCNDIEKEAGFIIDYYTDRIESTGKYVCKLCYKIPVKCDCQ
jgi:hypothetical protein